MRSILFNVGTFSCSSSSLPSVYRISYTVRIVSKCVKAGVNNWIVFYFIAFISSIHSKRLRTQTRDDVVNADFAKMTSLPGSVAVARVKPCHLPACTKQHLIHSLVLSIDHNKHPRSGPPTRDFFISAGWPTSAMWFFQEGLLCHQAWSIRYHPLFSLYVKISLKTWTFFRHFVVFRQLQLFVSCFCLIITVFLLLWRCDPKRVMASSFLRFSRSHTTTHHSR
jgi:hypothetical protein